MARAGEEIEVKKTEMAGTEKQIKFAESVIAGTAESVEKELFILKKRVSNGWRAEKSQLRIEELSLGLEILKNAPNASWVLDTRHYDLDLLVALARFTPGCLGHKKETPALYSLAVGQTQRFYNKLSELTK